MELIEKSLEIALKAYSGLVDKSGSPYILHPLRVMSKMETEEEMAIALLHDVIEDSTITAKDLLEIGFSKTIVDAVSVLTKKKNERYDYFINRVLKSKLATKIKIYDIEDNMNLLRLNTVSKKDLQRLEKYHKAWNVLTQVEFD
jgi:(p)ppGpp synthase/HD superfamily hydrolase